MEQVYPGKMVTDAVSQTIRSLGEIGQSTIKVIFSTAVAGLHSIREVVTETTYLAGDNLANTISATRTKGAAIGCTGKGALIGTIQSAGEISVATIEVISNTIRAAIKGVSGVRGDAAKMFQGAAQGTLSLIKNVGLRIEEAVFGVARVAISTTRDTETDSASIVGNGGQGSTGDNRAISDNYLNVYYSTSREVIRGTAEIVSDLVSPARSIVERAISSIESIAVSAEEAVSSIITGAVKSSR